MQSLPRHALSALCTLAVLAVPAALDAQELDGRWSLRLSAAEGVHTFVVTLSVDGEDVAGTAGDETFSGTFKDGRLRLTGEHYVGEAGYSAMLELTGTVDGDRIRGSASWDMFEASVTGNRVEDGARPRR